MAPARPGQRTTHRRRRLVVGLALVALLGVSMATSCGEPGGNDTDPVPGRVR